MGFWIFMLASDLLIPLTMVVLGSRFYKKPPKCIQSTFGYRTARSMKSKKTWDYAHRFLGKLWLTMGIFLLPISVSLMLLVPEKPKETVSIMGLVVCGIQLAALLASLIPTELALKIKFDK